MDSPRRMDSAQRGKVLVVDDDARMTKLLKMTLEDRHYGLFFACNGDQALAITEREKPDLMFLDIMMPGRNGYEVCRTVKSRKSTAGVRVVMLSSLDGDDARRRAMEAGADGYISKPFSPLDLIRQVEETLRAYPRQARLNRQGVLA